MYKSILFDNNLISSWFIIIRKASWKNPTFYDILGIPKSATAKEIKVAYYKKCKEYHPDKNQDNKSHDKFIKIQKAYDTLSQDSLRRNYDMTLQSNQYSPPVHSSNNRSSYYQQNPHQQQTYYYYYGSKSSYSDSEFDRFMRYRNSQNFNQNQAQNNDFSSPLRVMVILILILGLLEAFTFSWIYDRDMSHLHKDNHNNYSPLNRHVLAEFQRQVNQSDEHLIDEKIREYKQNNDSVK